jgi:dephospho-CoA kinase
MMAFGQKSYLLALDQTDQVLAVMGWQVENLITRADEVFFAPGAPVAALVGELVTAVEAASKDLQSEVAYIFLPGSTAEAATTAFAESGYESTAVDQIKVPAWREAVQEVLNATKAAHIYTKKLGNRILKPI